jgi:YD repeat-containing protein
MSRQTIPLRLLCAVLTSAFLLTAAVLARDGLPGNRWSRAAKGPDVQATTREANGLGAVGEAEEGSEGITTYTYDGAGRLVGVDYGGGKGITYTYDAAGNLLYREAYGAPTETPTPTPTSTATPTPTPTQTPTVPPTYFCYLPLILR